MPNGTASAQLPISIGRMKPSTSISQIALANAQGTCVPSPSALARRNVRNHHSSTEVDIEKPAICHQPPFASGTNSWKPYSGPGGSSASHGNCRANWIGSQPTDAHMLSPITSNARKPNISDRMPSPPR